MQTTGDRRIMFKQFINFTKGMCCAGGGASVRGAARLVVAATPECKCEDKKALHEAGYKYTELTIMLFTTRVTERSGEVWKVKLVKGVMYKFLNNI